ncbi:CAP domain-containing protein [Sinirhodobacter populi]|uniref:CAP domain-containing protein n=1 Tax=Paenirhodobacter populi TaxID=2306993 RepID=A0A443KJW1_9RHOB|nr:CAP domain-containing protein [Sinirhodobacter populi]RWR33004.1 CAP domain-containing protein [Sinirhodobacter populi]
MSRVKALILFAVMGLAACQPSTPQLGPDGQPLPQLYRISNKDAAEIPGRVTEAINSLRAARGTAPLTLEPTLTQAAEVHSRDMARQNRAWHWGSDGSSPFDRASRAGFPGKVAGENISETYENETQTLSTWMADAETRDVILNPAATMMGFGWYQEPSGKIWWTLVTGHY